MKTVILVRHAKTEQLTDYSKSDFDRKLLPRGESDSFLVAEQLKNKGYLPDIFVTSSAKRAKQTSLIFAEKLNYSKADVIAEQFIYDGYTTSTMLSYFAKFDNLKDTVILFGHNPDIAGLTVNLTSEDLFHFPTGVLTVLNFNVNTWNEIEARMGKVALYLYPNMLK